MRASVVAVCGFSSCSPRAWLPHSKWNLPGPGIQTMCPALADGLPTTGPPGKPPANSCETVTYSWILARTRWVCEWGRGGPRRDGGSGWPSSWPRGSRGRLREGRRPGVPSAAFTEQSQVRCAEVSWGILFSSSLRTSSGLWGWREDDFCLLSFPQAWNLFYMS